MGLLILIVAVIGYIMYTFSKNPTLLNDIEEISNKAINDLKKVQTAAHKNKPPYSENLLLVTNEITSNNSSLSKKDFNHLSWVKLQESGEIVSMALTQDAEFMASGDSDGNIVLWDLNTGKKIKSLTVEDTSTITAIDITPDARYVVFTNSDNFVKFWDTKSNEEVPFKTMGDRIRALAITQNGKYTISAGSQLSYFETGNFVKIWDKYGNSEKIPGFNKYSRDITLIAITSDCKYIVTADNNGNIRLFHITYATNENNVNATYRHISPILTDLPDIKDCQLIKNFKDYNKMITALAVDSKAEYIVSSNGSSIKVWNTVSGKLVHQIRRDFTHYIQSINIHDNRIISASLHKKAFEIPKVHLKHNPSNQLIETVKNKQKKNIKTHKLLKGKTNQTIKKENSQYAKDIQDIQTPNFEKIRRYCNNLVFGL